MFLCLDSCGDQGLLVLADPQAEPIAYRAIIPTFGEDRVKVFLDALQDILHSESVQLEKITGYLVIEGPGRYTGIRLGLSFFHGLCLPNAPKVIRRDHVYAGLLGGDGWLLMDSGRARAYTFHTAVDKVPMLRSEDALLPITPTSEDHARAVCLLGEKDQGHYQAFFTSINAAQGSVIFPDLQQRAECLSRAISSL